ncbi:MAG: Asp-tRNA(Asn)/Glu-tRNA(Gln) amidotransferase subunit GatA [Oscillospiraceae bacterium]|jgi:aspartyl-tRNA(Asn)/glutamyl-tRNA(Gln) amidotransferase subunit A
MDFEHLTVKELREKLDGKEVSAAELTQAYLSRIAEKDPEIKSFLTVCEDSALKQAEAAQKKIDAGEATALTGIPFGIKDNICTEGVKTTCASKMLGDFVPPYNATVMRKLEEQGIVTLGKLNMDEFAMGGSTATSYFKKTVNPYDFNKVPGGSSGGSAACVAAELAPVALGSDTGGSIRQPSSFCGVTGLKPTYGAVSRFGLVAFASSLDQIGPIAKSAVDCGAVFNSICGFDPHDGTTSKHTHADALSLVGQSVKGLKIAVPKEFFDAGIDDEVKQSVMAAVKAYEAMGAQAVEVSMPTLKYAIPAYYLISSAEASSNLSRYDGIKYGYRAEGGGDYNELIRRTRDEGFGTEVKRRILLGTYALASGYYDAYYKKALYLKGKIREEYNAIFDVCDVMITPTAPSTAFGFDEGITDPAKMYLADICTVTVNIAGLPAISTPCGYDKNGMPIGMSIVGRAFDEARIIQVADAFEQTFERIAPKL